MKYIINILVIAISAWILSSLIAWWMIAVMPFVIAVANKQKAGAAFASSFVAIAMLWLYLIMQTDIANESILSTRIAQLFGLGHTLFLIVNVLVGGLVGGLGGWSGAAMRSGFQSDK